MFEETNEKDDSVNDEVGINVRDINLPADRANNENATNLKSNAMRGVSRE